jgi:hypothetical protein
MTTSDDALCQLLADARSLIIALWDEATHFEAPAVANERCNAVLERIDAALAAMGWRREP